MLFIPLRLAKVTPMEIKTARLLLREFQASDLDKLFMMERREDFRRYRGEPMSREETADRLRLKISDAQANPRVRYYLAVILPPSDHVIGQISARVIQPYIREWEVTWNIHPNYWGKGYATEGARAILDMVFRQMNGHRAIAICHTENHASIRVAEKVGMQREGRTRQTILIAGVWHDEYLYSLLEEEYK
jgi:[ribosomal protein S5]-alanine N-acetyltransferase